ncbi:MAG: synthase [Thermoleophilaceae bacterium]|jgi:FO synthase|nr:synthase [Thermoleophilaceae bacterium]
MIQTSAARRALRRARDAVALNTAECTELLHLRGEALDELCATAAAVRDVGLRDLGRPAAITYSPKVFIPLTRLCRDRCHYCTFVANPGALKSQGVGLFMPPEEVLDLCRRGAALGCKEALFTLGDRPEERWPAAQAWLGDRGFETTLEYVRAMAILVLEETGLLPHLNPGVMSWTELQRLKPVAPSMGMMLETTSTRLWAEPGGPHHGSPDKEPAVRLRVLEDAGRLSIPFTTGLLIGIGETAEERAESLLAIRRVSRQYRGIQEVIIQNFRAKASTAMAAAPDLELEEYRAVIAVARIVLGPQVRIQAPPNLVDPEECGLLLKAGVDDWGGVSPVTPDHVNPERPWPPIDRLRALTAASGFALVERLTVQPEFVRRGEPWVDARVAPHVHALADGTTGLVAAGAQPRGRPWQASNAEQLPQGRVELHSEIDTIGRSTDRRSDFADVYGDWGSLREASALRDGSAPPRLESDVRTALRRAADAPADLTDEQAMTLLTADGRALDEVCRLADEVRQDTVGDEVTYVINRNINFTNICYVGCRFCAFAQRRTDTDAYALSLEQVGERVAEAWDLGATEICMQGGISPDLRDTAYFELARRVKRSAPSIHLHAFSPMEIMHGVSLSRMALRDWLQSAKDAGLDSIPGTAAEILDDDIRWILTKGKLPASVWVDVVTTAHRLGIRSSSTMMYGHVDKPAHWVAHLRVLTRIQDETGGFTEFVPLPFIHHNAPIYLAGIARPGPTMRDNRAVHAVSRLMLHGRIDNIQCSWVKLGVAGTRQLLRGGANDLGGTLMEETISRMAGSEHGSAKSAAELVAIAEGIGRPTRQRTTLYDLVPTPSHRLPTTHEKGQP